MGKSATQHPESRAAAGLHAMFCSKFDGVCTSCPNRSNLADTARAGREPQLPPFAEGAIRTLARCRRLTAREREVLTLCCRGAKNSMIAAGLGISVSAVRRHLRNLHKKTNTSDKAELILNLWHSCQIPGEILGAPRKTRARSRARTAR